MSTKPSNFRLIVVAPRAADSTKPEFRNGGIGVTVHVMHAQWEEGHADTTYRKSGQWLAEWSPLAVCRVECILPVPEAAVTDLILQYGLLVGARQLRIVGMTVLHERSENPQPRVRSALVRLTALRSLAYSNSSNTLLHKFIDSFTKFCDKRIPGAINALPQELATFPTNDKLYLVERYSADPSFYAYPVAPEPRHIDDVRVDKDERDDVLDSDLL